LHVVAAYSNPFRWQTRRELALDFRKHMEAAPNVELHFIELAYGDRPFEVTDPALHPNDVQFRSSAELFHKENLLNLGVQRLPPGWRYGAVIDADFHFTRYDWALEAIHQLQHHDWVQLFSIYQNLDGEVVPGAGHRPVGQPSNGFAYGFHRSGGRIPEAWCAGMAEPYSGALASAKAVPWLGAPGGAWAFRRSAWDAVGGLMERCILGSGDWYAAFGLAGYVLDHNVENRLGKKSALYQPAYLKYVRDWQERARDAFHGNIGYVDCFAVHHFHGPLAKRGYAERDTILVDNAFDPFADVHPDWQGVLQLTPRKSRLRDDVRRYFLSRNEDLPNQ
jgi:hypothetical protein